jgi:hypothetical protein
MRLPARVTAEPSTTLLTSIEGPRGPAHARFRRNCQGRKRTWLWEYDWIFTDKFPYDWTRRNPCVQAKARKTRMAAPVSFRRCSAALLHRIRVVRQCLDEAVNVSQESRRSVRRP